MNRTASHGFLDLATLVAGLLISSLTYAATTLPGLPDEGWAMWQTDAVPDAPRWCCRVDYHGPETVCRLDQKTGFYGSADGRTTQAVRIYVHMDGGRLASLERLATTDSSGQVRARAWFWLAQIEAPGIEAAIRARLAEEPDAEAREQMVFALSQLPAERALAALSDLIEDPALDRRVRKQAIFWLAQNESPEALARIEELLAGENL